MIGEFIVHTPFLICEFGLFPMGRRRLRRKLHGYRALMRAFGI